MVRWDSSPRTQAWIQVWTSVEVRRPGEIVWTASEAVIDSGATADAPAWQAAIVERIATRTVEVRGVISQRIGVQRIEVCAAPLQSIRAEVVIEIPGTVVDCVRVQAVEVDAVMMDAAELCTIVKSGRQPTISIQAR